MAELHAVLRLATTNAEPPIADKHGEPLSNMAMLLLDRSKRSDLTVSGFR